MTTVIANKKLSYRRDTVSILLPLLRSTPPLEGFPWEDLRKIVQGGHGMARVHSGEEILPKVSTPLSRAHERYRRQTDRETDLRYKLLYSSLTY